MLLLPVLQLVNVGLVLFRPVHWPLMTPLYTIASVWMTRVLAKDKSAHLYPPNEPDGSAPQCINISRSRQPIFSQSQKVGET